MIFGRPQLIILLLLFLAGLLWWRAPEDPQLHSRTALIMGTVVEIKAFSADEERLEKAMNAAFAVYFFNGQDDAVPSRCSQIG